MFIGQFYTYKNKKTESIVSVYSSEIPNTDNYQVRFRTKTLYEAIDNYILVGVVIVSKKIYKKIINFKKLNKLEKMSIMLNNRAGYFYIQKWYEYHKRPF